MHVKGEKDCKKKRYSFDFTCCFFLQPFSLGKAMKIYNFYYVFKRCGNLDQLEAFNYLFSFRITVSVAEEQLKWILIMKQESKVIWER